jgi:hypothetical protein
MQVILRTASFKVEELIVYYAMQKEVFELPPHDILAVSKAPPYFEDFNYMVQSNARNIVFKI